MITREALYSAATALSLEFLEANDNLPIPKILTYEEALSGLCRNKRIETFFRRAVGPDMKGAARRRYTGLYYMSHIFVNLPVTALPVERPGFQRWSYPGWKTDRTAVGVVAHELGHFVAHAYAISMPAWRLCLAQHAKKPISGYAPTAEEQFAETVRLFITNPDLLKKAVPWRYNYLTDVVCLAPVKKRLRLGWKGVLRNPAYWPPAERWIGVRNA
jgi:hypothetical protein